MVPAMRRECLVPRGRSAHHTAGARGWRLSLRSRTPFTLTLVHAWCVVEMTGPVTQTPTHVSQALPLPCVHVCVSGRTRAEGTQLGAGVGHGPSRPSSFVLVHRSFRLPDVSPSLCAYALFFFPSMAALRLDQF